MKYENYEKMPISVHAGGAWEGHVFLMIKKGDKIENTNIYYGVESSFFLSGSASPKEVLSIIVKKLQYMFELGYIIPPLEIDEHKPISSASKFLEPINEELYQYFLKTDSLLGK